MAGTVPATPNQTRRLRLLEAAVADVREGAPVGLTAGIADLYAAPGAPIAGFTVEAVEPDLVGPGSYTEPVFGPGGGVSGGPFVVDVHPGAADGSREQVLVAIGAPGSTFIMDYEDPPGSIGTPPITAVGAVFSLIADADNGAYRVDGATLGIGVDVVGVNIVSGNVNQNQPNPSRFRLEVALLNPQLPG